MPQAVTVASFSSRETPSNWWTVNSRSCHFSERPGGRKAPKSSIRHASASQARFFSISAALACRGASRSRARLMRREYIVPWV